MWKLPWKHEGNPVRCCRVDPSDPSSAYRSLECLDGLQDQLDPQIDTLADVPRLCAERFPTKQTLGTRKILAIQQEKQTNGKVFKKYLFGDYEYLTYNECWQQIEAIGRGFVSLNLKKNESILIFSETRREWLLSAFAAFRHGFPLVTLYPTLGEDALKHAAEQTEVSTILISHELVPKLNKILGENSSIRHVIYFPSIDPNERKALSSPSSSVEMISFEQFKLRHLSHQIDETRAEEKPKTDDIAVIMYTSGSTGVPKGVLIEHRNILSSMAGQRERLLPLADLDNDVYIAYLPLAHILELTCELLIFSMGIQLGYSSPQTLTDQSTAIRKGDQGDLQLLRPHLMCAVPTILDRIHKSIEEKINQLNFVHRNGFNLSYSIKLKRSTMGLPSPHLDQLIFSRLNGSILGGRMKTLICGGALLSEETQRFIRTTLCLTVLQGYGLTETCASGTLPDHDDPQVGLVGHPLVCCEIRLKNWEEGNYRNTDFPHPRGEILLGGSNVARGYFRATEQDDANFQQIEGTNYFATGDIGEIFADGSLKIIDRKKDLVKLRGGEYLSLTKVEMVINKLPFVDQSCLYARSAAEFAVLLLCPNRKHFAEFCEKHLGDSDWPKLLAERRKEVDAAVLKEIDEHCRKSRIERFEIPQRVALLDEVWTPDTGLLTDAFKLKRKAIESKYQQNIDELYA